MEGRSDTPFSWAQLFRKNWCRHSIADGGDTQKNMMAAPEPTLGKQAKNCIEDYTPLDGVNGTEYNQSIAHTSHLQIHNVRSVPTFPKIDDVA
jgi:hypothetical protein